MRAAFLGMTLLLLANTWACGQSNLPDAMTRLVNDDTLVVIHLDLKTLNVAPGGTSFAALLDPIQPLSQIAGGLDQAFAKLKMVPVSDVYCILGTTDLPLDGVLVVPTTEPRPVLEALRSVWPNDVEELAGTVLAGSAQARARLRAVKSAPRVEFATAMEAVRGTSIRVAIAPSQDARRVIREFLPVLPQQLGGGELANSIDGTTWLALGLNVPPKVEVRLIVQGSNPTSTEALRGIIEKLATLAFQSEVAKKVLPKSNELLPLFIPKRDNDRLTLLLNDANGGAKRLTEEVLPPLVELARSNSRQSAAIGNMKHLGLAMHNYHDANKAFPPAASLAKDGKQKLLSWRVLILPFLDQQGLYNQFHLDEAWDSPHNKTLIAKMPDVYETGNITTEQRKQAMTTFLVPVGPKTVFAQSEGVRIRDITDGTSNTIMIVDASKEKATIWTKPDDLLFDPEHPWLNLDQGGLKQFRATFCDGSVRRLGESTKLANLRRYFQMNDGEIIEE
ncbi:MAG: hypothetical protein JWP89_3274 [Schlesneria sp.]|nr:hypothetical protein [Schlesneria sp.]